MNFIEKSIKKTINILSPKSNYNYLNNLFGWVVFFIALLTYFLTLEPTTSFWDCGEYIATAHKIQVGHPPGAPLFLILGNFFSNLGFGDSNVAYMINFMSALCSALTILFLFWSISLLMKKSYSDNLEKTRSKFFILFSASIGALVYTFSDSFWFSAVEGEVYAMSSLFTALVFWCILKWEDGFSKPRSSKWLIFISFLIGLSIGVHMLNLLAIPAIVIIYCYKKNWLWSKLIHESKDEPFKVFLLSTSRFVIFNLFGIFLLALIYYVLVPQIVNISGKTEIYFINELNFPLNSGTIFFFLTLTCIIIGGLIVSQKNKLVKLNTIILSFLFFLIGYSMFFVLIIRSNANTPIDENNPEDAVSLLAYLNREQYGSKPLFWGEYFNTDTVLVENSLGEITSQTKSSDGNPVYTKGFLIKDGMDKIAECFSKDCIKQYNNKSDSKFSNYIIKEKYLISDSRKNINIVHEKNNGKKYSCECGLIEGIKYDGEKKINIIDKTFLEQNGYIRNTGDEFNIQNSCTRCGTNIRKLKEKRELITTGFFPRMWSSQRGGYHIDPSWSNPRDNRPGYLDWAGISNCNECLLISDKIERKECEKNCYDKNNPRAITFAENLKFFKEFQIDHMYWRYFMWNFSGRQNDTQGHGGIIDGNWITGINFIDNKILNLGPQNNLPEHIKNQKGRNTYYLLPFILGLIGLLFNLFNNKRDFWAIFLLFFFTGIAIVIELNQTPFQPRERDYAYVGSFYAFAIWIGFGALAILEFFKSAKQFFKVENLIFQKSVLVIISLLLLGIPTLMAVENWDDHDRSNRYTARDFAKNYLNSCEKNAILFNMGDNDTFPLWYVQEVEDERTDVRPVNLSLLNTDWYINQMRKDAYEGKGVEFNMDPHLYRQGGGGRDVAYKMDVPADERLFKNGFDDLKKAQEISLKNGGETWALSDFNEWIISEDSYTKIQYPIGCKDDCTELKYFPNKKIILPEPIKIKEKINEEIILLNKKLKTENEFSEIEISEIESEIKFKENELSKIESEIIISINAGNLSKANLMILNMLEQNNWERPIYFATTIGNPSPSNPDFLFLHEYFQLDGLVYKLFPIKNESGKDSQGRYIFKPRINSNILFENIMSFEWGGLDSKHDIYLDETNLRMIRNLKNIFLQLSTKLIEEEKYDLAKNVIETSLEKIPPKKVPLQDYDCTNYANNEGSLIENYFKIIDKEKDDSTQNIEFEKLMGYTNEILNRYSSELKYYSSFSKKHLSQMDIQSLLYSGVSTINEVYKLRTSYIPQQIINKESNLLIDSNVTESLKEIEILASNGILQESLPLIIDAYYYNQNNSNSADSILSKWMNKETLPNLIKEELLKIAFQNKHINKDKFLEKLFKTNFNILKEDFEFLKLKSSAFNNPYDLQYSIETLFEMGTSGGLCYNLIEDPYKIYWSSSFYSLMKIEFELFYKDMINWLEIQQSDLTYSNPNLENSKSECNCLMKFYGYLNNLNELENNCIEDLSSLAEFFSVQDDSLIEKKYNDLMKECPMELEMFISYLMQQQEMSNYQ